MGTVKNVIGQHVTMNFEDGRHFKSVRIEEQGECSGREFILVGVPSGGSYSCQFECTRCRRVLTGYHLPDGSKISKAPNGVDYQ